MLLKIACPCGHVGLVSAERLPAELRCWQCGSSRRVEVAECKRIRSREAVIGERAAPCERAMSVAMIYPEPEKGGRGKKGPNKLDGFSKEYLTQARAVVPYPDLSKAVLDGSMSFPNF